MRNSATTALIAKDCRLHIRPILLSVLGGLAALGVLAMGGKDALVPGAALFFSAIIFCAGFLPMANIVNERKKKTLAFVMSLPVSPAQYGIAKLASTLGLFLIPWLALVAAGLYMILDRHILPNGAIPTALILSVLPLIGFCLITGIALITDSETAGTAATAVITSSYWLGWYLIASQAPSLTSAWGRPDAVWNGTAVAILCAEAATIAAVLLVTAILQARKREFL